MRHTILLLLLGIHPILFGQPNHTPDSVIKKIDDMALQYQWAFDIPGFAVGVIMDNQVIFKKAYGFQNFQTKGPLTTTSDFHMASVSKPFAATAILQLVEAGQLHLDSTIVHYLPYFKMNDPRYNKITLYHLLTHSSGLPDVTNYEWENPQTGVEAAENYTKSFSQKDLDFEPGTQFNYSNSAYNLMADIISKASGQNFEHYTQAHIFKPLGMIHSSFLLSDINVNRMAVPHKMGQDLEFIENPVYPYNRIHAPSSTLHSNLDDMLLWAEVFLNKGTINQQTLISEDTWNNMLQPRLKVNDDFNVCLSWFTVQIASKTIYFHSGGDTGYRTFVGFEPESKTSVVLMGNNDLFDATQPAFDIFKSIFENTTLLTKKPIYMQLRHYIFKDGIQKVKQVYFDTYKANPDRFLFGPDNVIPLANWLYEHNYILQAIDVLVFCTELEPQVPKWYQYIAEVYLAEADNENAILWFKKVLALDPSNSELEKKISDLNKL